MLAFPALEWATEWNVPEAKVFSGMPLALAIGMLSLILEFTNRRSGRNAAQPITTAAKITPYSSFLRFIPSSPSELLVQVFVVAAEDAARVLVVMHLGAEDGVLAAQPQVKLGREQHSEGRCREIDPERIPDAAGQC